MMQIDMQDKAPVKSRFFWTWDHCMEWVLNQPGAQNVGASNYYNRTPELFVEDYARLIRWCGENGVDGVVVWGLLRDSHGGIESAKKLCDIANQNNVRLLCGVGLNAYGGVYYEGDSPYSLEKHLISNPELYGIDQQGRPMIFDFGAGGPRVCHHACPSRRENQEFAAESLRWLFETLPGLGGVQVESGDTGVCRCKLCNDRRKHGASMFSWEDMALMYPIAAEAVRSVNPEACIICETYSHPEKTKYGQMPGGFGDGRPDWSDSCLDSFPEGVYVQWAGDRYCKPYSEKEWTDAGTIHDPRRHHIMRTHHSTYYFNNKRGEVAFDWIADIVQKSIAHGIDSTSIFGELSPFHTGARLNYLALANLGSADNPEADLDVFLRDVAGQVLGGEQAARDYLRCARAAADRIPEALEVIRRYIAQLPSDYAAEWIWLGNFLRSIAWENRSL